MTPWYPLVTRSSMLPPGPVLVVLSSLASLSLSGCQFPGAWVGSWHHLGYDHPLNVSLTSIDMKVNSVRMWLRRTGFWVNVILLTCDAESFPEAT